jgi:hypothetical protein
MKTKMRILSILFAFIATLGTARADLLTLDVLGPQGSASFTNGGSGPVFGLVNTTGITGVVGANFTLGIDSALFSIATIQLTNTLDTPQTISIFAIDPNFGNSMGPVTLATTLSVSNLSTPGDWVSTSSWIDGSSSFTGPVTVLAPSGTAVSGPVFFDVNGALINRTVVGLSPGAETTFTVTTQIAAVPEPSSLLLASSALVGFFCVRRRRA